MYISSENDLKAMGMAGVEFSIPSFP